ncbi:MAG: DNA mismatch repair protein MutS, partial [Mogibacterium sp.]|nr:DNA mismatch repair protein MutS [Mogibacterium sp.]
MALSPMMQQYNSIKDKYNDCLIMFRLGDFYELFFDDAIIASRVLELTLTGRNCGLDEKAPMCGVPHHAVDSYLVRLVKAGYKVAICEQLEDPATAKGIVERDVVRIVTPGTIDVLEGSESDDNIYIASVQIGEGTTAVAISDISTGEFFCFDFADETGDILASELARYMPREVISSVNCEDALNAILSNATINPFINYYDEPYFKFSACEETIKRHFDVTSLMAFGIDGRDELIEASGSLLMYLMDTQKQAPSQIKDFTVKNITNSMQLDRSTMRNLELLETLFDKDVHGSLFGVLNKTKTAMGARLLKSMLKEPLKDAAEINLRLEAVKELKDNPHSANILNVCLRQAYDLQRLSARIASGRANARDLQALRVTLDQMPIISDELSNYSSDLIKNIRKSILCEESRQAITYDFPFIEIAGKIESAIVDEPPFLITEGGIIRDGYSDKLKELKDSIADAKLWISNLENTEKERTGIKTIKVGFNKVFGYYIDVSKSFIDKVPPEYIRKQTLVNNERYITPELKEKETLVLSAESKINTIEYELFKELRESIEPHVSNLQKVSSAIAMLDVLLSFAKVAQENNYVQPTVDNSDNIIIENGRHPTVEKMIGAGLFV